MQLSVVILNYNVRYFLQLCLQSVEAAIKTIDAEIIVVDNNSTDDSCNMVKTHFPNVTLIENKDNVGFSKGNNIGVKHAKGQYVCILNPDTVVAEDTFEKTLLFAKVKSNFGILGCQLIDGTGQFLPESKRNIPTPLVALKKTLGFNKSYYATKIAANKNGQVKVLVGAFMLLKRKTYTKLNGFDERFFMYGEDIDLSYRALQLGLTNYYFGETCIIHYKGESTLKNKLYAQRFYGAMDLFYKKHFSSNILFNALVKLGIMTSRLLGKPSKEKEIKATNYLLISDSKYKDLQQKLNKPIKILSKTPKHIDKNTQLILDAKILSFKTIIETLKVNYNCGLSFKILPKNNNYIIGSNSPTSRGKIISF